MSDGGGNWDRWEGWVPGDPIPSEDRPEGVADRAAHRSPSDRATGRGAPDGARQGSGAVATLLGVVVALVVLGGLAAVVLMGSVTDESSDGPIAVTEPTIDDGPGSMADTASLDLVRQDLSPLLVDLETAIGEPHRLRRLVVYPGYGVADVEPPDEPGQIDVWVLYPGRVSGPTPQRDVGDIEDSLFRADELDPGVMAGLVARTVQDSGIDDADQPYLIIERHASGQGAVTVTVYLSGARSSGWARYGASGEVLESSDAS
ncbi:MAG: hypothetical protein ACXIVQ_04155 [Acidimicrobiales bacterium]